MGKTLKKRILISAEQSQTPIGILFQEVGFELAQEQDETLEYQFIIDDYLPEVKKIPRLQTKKLSNHEIGSAIRAHIDDRHLSNPNVRKLLSSYLMDSEGLDLVDRFSRDYKNVYTLKLHDYLNIGYFIDLVVTEAYKNNFDYEEIRHYLNKVIEYSFKIAEDQVDQSPIDISYSYSNVGFALQVSFKVTNVNFMKVLSNVKDISMNSNFFDLHHFQKRKRLNIAALWFKDNSLKDFHTYFITQTLRKVRADERVINIVNRLDEKIEDARYKVIKRPFVDQFKKMQMAKKICVFLKKYSLSNSIPSELSCLSLDELDSLLLEYPNQNDIKDIDDDVKKFTLKMLQDNQLDTGVDKYLDTIAEVSPEAPPESLNKVSGFEPLEELMDFIRSNENFDDKKESDKDDVVVVEEIKVENKPEEKVKISLAPVAEPEAKRLTGSALANSYYVEKLEERILRMKKVIEQMKVEMLKMADELKKPKNNEFDLDQASLNLNEQKREIDELKQALALSLNLIKNKDATTKKFKDDLALALDLKNKKISELEARIEKVKIEFSTSEAAASIDKMEKLIQENKNLSTRLEISNRKVNIISENMLKLDNETLEKKDKEINTLKNNIQIAQMLIERAKVDKIDLENKLIAEREKVSALKEEKVTAQPVVREADRIAAKDLEADKNNLITTLVNERKNLEERLKAQAIEIKKYEQKLKFMDAKVEEAQKKKATTLASAAKSSDTYAKQLENASVRVGELGADLADKKKEIIKLKLENTVLSTKIVDLEKKVSILEKKAA